MTRDEWRAKLLNELVNPKYRLDSGIWYDPNLDYLKIREAARLRAYDELNKDPEHFDSTAHFLSSDIYVYLLEDQCSWGQAQKNGILTYMKVAVPVSDRLTEEEAEYLVYKLQGVNDPVGLSVLDKMGKFLSELAAYRTA